MDWTTRRQVAGRLHAAHHFQATESRTEEIEQNQEAHPQSKGSWDVNWGGNERALGQVQLAFGETRKESYQCNGYWGWNEQVAKNEMNEWLLGSLQHLIIENLELIKKAEFETYPFIDVLW